MNNPRTVLIALTGRPNAGKSTLLNALLGEKLSAVTHKAQTTRHLIRGVLTRAEDQFVFMDLPGIHGKQHNALNRYMNRVATGSLAEVDLVLLLVEAGAWQPDDELALQQAVASGRPVALVVSKVDRLRNREQLLPLLQQASLRHGFEFVVPLSATRRQNLDGLMQELSARLQPGPHMFDEEQLTDRSERFIAAEVIREKLMLMLHQELPYKLTVEIEQFTDTESGSNIDAVIWVERDSQKGIVIGNRGAGLKRVGREARLELNQRLGRRVHLQLWVRARAGWADDERGLRSLGYE